MKFPFFEPKGHFFWLWGILSGGITYTETLCPGGISSDNSAMIRRQSLCKNSLTEFAKLRPYNSTSVRQMLIIRHVDYQMDGLDA